MKDNSRITVNTAVMYGRLAVTMMVTLLSSRWVLLALGKEDFGIYNLVAGLLSLLMFLNMTMATASQRFLSFALGKGQKSLIEETFYYSCLFHLFVGLIIVAGIESVGQLLLHTVLQVPVGKMHLAIFCLHALSVSTFVTVVSVPYHAVLMAHENIIFIAIVEMLSAIFKLIAAVFLLDYNGERLKLYAIFMAVIPILQVIAYRNCCYRKYPETHIRIRRISDRELFWRFLSYVGWNLIGAISSMLRTQGVSMLLNSFYGVAMNAAYGIASQVSGQLTNFSSSITTVARPQIVKSEGQGNRQRVLALSATTSKVAFLLFAMLGIPLIVEMPYILKIWLKEVPEYTVSFTRLVVLIGLAFQFAIGISIPVESVGKIRQLQIWVGGLHFIVLPVGYMLLKQGFPPYSVFVVVLCEEIVSTAIRLVISHKVVGLNIALYVKETILPSLMTSISLFIVSIAITWMIDEGFIRLFFLCGLSLIYTIIVGYHFALTEFEKGHAMEILQKVIARIRSIS